VLQQEPVQLAAQGQVVGVVELVDGDDPRPDRPEAGVRLAE
jgi:hypothetical protein